MARGGKRPGAGRKPGLASILAEHTRAFIADYLNQNIEPMVEAIGEKAKKGDVMAFKELYDRAHGKAPQSMDVTTQGKEMPQPLLYVLNNDSDQEGSKAQ